MSKIRDWTNTIADSREGGSFSEEVKRDATDFRYCLIAEWNQKTGRELQTEFPVLASFGYAFCEAVSRDQPELAYYVKEAIDTFIKEYVL